MDVQERLDELAVLIEDAKAMPLSASCIVNRAQVLDLRPQRRVAGLQRIERQQLDLVHVREVWTQIHELKDRTSTRILHFSLRDEREAEL